MRTWRRRIERAGDGRPSSTPRGGRRRRSCPGGTTVSNGCGRRRRARPDLGVEAAALVEAAELPRRQVHHEDDQEHDHHVEDDPAGSGQEPVTRHPGTRRYRRRATRQRSARICGRVARVATGDVFPDRDMEHRDKVAWMVEQHGWAFEPVPAHPELDPPIPGLRLHDRLRGGVRLPRAGGVRPHAGGHPRACSAWSSTCCGAAPRSRSAPLFTGLFDNDLRSALLPVDREECGDLFAVADDWYGGERLPGGPAGLARPQRLAAVGVRLRPPAAAGPADGRRPRRPRLSRLARRPTGSAPSSVQSVLTGRPRERAMTRRWISLVPSPISSTFTSR